MANSDDNLMMRNLHGTIGGQVVCKVRNGKSIMTNVPKRRKKGPVGGQEGVRDIFSEASAWGKHVMSDPELKDFYKSRAQIGMNAYTTALRDSLNAPLVSVIDTSGYSGHPGEIILVTADEDLMVVKVNVVIADSYGVILEEGICTSDDSINWHYTAKTLIDPVGYTITATAFDNPGNAGTLSVTIV